MTITRTTSALGRLEDRDLLASFAFGPSVTSLKDSLDVSNLKSKLKPDGSSLGVELRFMGIKIYFSPGDPEFELAVRVAASRLHVRTTTLKNVNKM